MLDITYEARGKEGPEIRLWGFDGEQQRVVVIDRSFLPSFFAIPREDPEATLREIESLRRVDLPLISSIKLVEKKYFGRPVKAIEIVCSDPAVLERYARRISKLRSVDRVLEDDLRYSTQYLIRTEVTPCAWHEVEVEEVGNYMGARVDRVYLAKETPKPIEEAKPVSLRVMSFAMMCYSKVGSPRPERDPIIVISVATNDGQEKQFMARDSSDAEVIAEFVGFVQEFDPDVIVGYASNREGWPYLIERAKRNRVALAVDRCDSEPHRSVYGHVSIVGRANVDWYDFAEDIPEIKVKTLANVADFLGVRKREERTIIEEVDIARYWDDPERRPKLLECSAEDARSILGISDAMLDFAIQLSSLTGLPLDHVGTAAIGFRVESFLMRRAHRLGELIPKRVERPYIPYVGALVLEPKPGMHEDVAVLDFKSMYPTLMIERNLSPDTYVPPKEPEPSAGVYVAPDVGHKFRRDPPGFYKQVLSTLIEARSAIRKKVKELDTKSVEYRILDARQKAIKVITNACYGYTGWIGARWFLKPVAEATTAWGRYAISSAIELASKLGLKIIYGDTDSLFVRYDPAKIEEFANEIEKQIGLEIKPDKIYKRILFTEAKKRYAGITTEGWLDIVGLEVVRGDWAEIAKNVQREVLKIILEERSVEKAVDYVRKQILALRGRKVPIERLIIWKALTKRLKEYAVRAPHVEAAKRLLEAGLELTLGDKVGYVIAKGPGKLYERAMPYTLASYDDIDLQYYEDYQIIPTAARILSVFDVSEEDLKPKTSLEGYLA